MADIENLVGTKLQGWSLTREVGRGADGIVYVGHKSGIETAVKIFFPDSFGRSGLEEARMRLEPQLSLIGRKHHPNIVEVYEGGELSELGTLYLVMELVPGASLDKLVGKIPPEAIANLAGQLASAAEYLETMDLVHRDIKPANIVISDDFRTLTLLDLSIVYQLPAEEDQCRLSGMEFVATLRYSPPEFVWRTEEGDASDAWRAVSFYQIGATLHDMIMGMPLFSGYDQPRARLYDCVRDRTPKVESKDVEGWLVQTVQACLLKDWRQRLHFVNWNSFRPPIGAPDVQQQERKIRLLQVRNEEIRQVKAKEAATVPGPNREQQIWNLNNSLFLEIRTYLFDSSVFPKFRANEIIVSQREYVTELHFDADVARGFGAGVKFTITLGVDSMLEDATKLSFRAEMEGKEITTSTWTEMFTVTAAFSLCRQSFLDAIETILSTT